jgi:hypothetical protein
MVFIVRHVFRLPSGRRPWDQQKQRPGKQRRTPDHGSEDGNGDGQHREDDGQQPQETAHVFQLFQIDLDAAHDTHGRVVHPRRDERTDKSDRTV